MKSLALFYFTFLSSFCFAQVNVTFNATSTIKTLNGLENGINLNYLMDDSYISASTVTTTTAALSSMGAKLIRYPGGEKV
jgi:hypothetical protein